MPTRMREHTLRTRVLPGDAEKVEALVAGTGCFSPAEVSIARELVLERLQQGEDSGYYFLFCERDGNLLGYACYGPRDGEHAVHDLYWIAVRPDAAGQGIGHELLLAVEKAVAIAGGRVLVAETSSTPWYAGARAFYQRQGFAGTCRRPEFYGPGDDLLEYTKILGRHGATLGATAPETP